jgi:hypothetical protein
MAGASRTAARGELGAPIRSAPAAKVNAHKTKEIQAKKLAFPWIPLAESGLFNGLQRIQIKKSRHQIFAILISNIPQALLAQTPSATRINRASNNNIAHILTFEKAMLETEGRCFLGRIDLLP